ncbi:unnamed protein product [Rotaria sp. Silwood2]|nr:unnamed protein product [Rotaria sp. Silwood2]CAF2562829.1 unnamed protein product [Rotaria sp. Silwood2]CAF2752835.1 unnamed protein product [Rotaria sp. Silwood2]CAF3884620.1 unnamed protein product [Rotaria sp. Silwood2]CAF3970696.1 unnamed protein product [Rotaria sp. Silwood2]
MKDHDHDHHHHHHAHHDHSSEDHDDHHKKHDHEHQSHHEHDAIVTVNMHNVLSLFKQKLQETEERIIAAIQHGQSSSPATAVKSYRIADR